jgi:hypothetical protein
MVAQGIEDVRSHPPKKIETLDIKIVLKDADNTLNCARAWLAETGE